MMTSLALTYVVRRHALSRGVLDRPNARSSHSIPTPRGGGLSIVIVVSVVAAVLMLQNPADAAVSCATMVGGLAVAAVGYLDDRNSLPVLARMVVHLASAIWAVYILGGLPPLQLGAAVVDLGFCGNVLAVFAIVWMLNLFNFMDGIDGIAASEAVFVAVAGAGLCWVAGIHSAVVADSVTVAAASLGFLLWNWPPAKIFMGDVGSGYLGYVLSILALAAARQNGALLYGWLILGGAFFCDATVTLIRRMLSRQRIFEAHRSHAYQWLARRWGSHKPVTITYIAVNVLWLFPAALLALRLPRYAVWITLFALTPLALAAVRGGAGRSERA